MSYVYAGVASAALTAKAYDYYKSSSKEAEAKSKLEDLQKQPIPQSTPDPTLLNYYALNLRGVKNPQGLTAGEKAAYNTDVTNNINTANYNATNTSGGNLSKYIATALNPAIVSGSNKLVGQDQAIKNQNYQSSLGRLGSSVSMFQNLRDRNAQNEYNRRLAIEQALGGAVVQQNRYQTETLDSTGNDLMGVAANVGASKLYAGKGTPTDTTGQNTGYDGVGNPYAKQPTTFTNTRSNNYMWKYQ